MRPPDYPRREVYPHAPLQLVAAELRYPYAPRLRQSQTLDAIQIELETLLPVRKPVTQFSVSVDPAGSLTQQNEEVFRVFNRSFTTSASVTPTTLTVETTAYTEFPEFQQVVHNTLLAVEKSHGPAAVERIGLRYVDEIRVPAEIDTAKDWEGWVSDELAAVARLVPGDPSGFQGAIESQTGPDQKLVLRFAALNGPGVVGNDPLMRKENPQPGPFFVVDVDSFWEPNSPDQSLDFDPHAVCERIADLHAPTGTAFQATLTDRLRTLFREGGGANT